MASQVSGSTDTPLYPNIINRGQRSSEVLLNVATECYIEGVSTREVRKIFNLFGIETISSTQVSNTSKKLDDSFEPWRNRDLGEFPYLMLNASYKKLRVAGIVRDVAVLIAVGVDRDGKRRILGVFVELKDAGFFEKFKKNFEQVNKYPAPTSMCTTCSLCEESLEIIPQK